MMPAGAEHRVVQVVKQSGFVSTVKSSQEEENKESNFARREKDEQCVDVPLCPKFRRGCEKYQRGEDKPEITFENTPCDGFVSGVRES